MKVLPSSTFLIAGIAALHVGCSAAAPEESGPGEPTSSVVSAISYPSSPRFGTFRFSDEDPGFSCRSSNLSANASVITAFGCYGSHCDDLEIKCEPVSETIIGTPHWTSWFSDESWDDMQWCGRDEWITALDCSGDYCDNIRFECSKIANIYHGGVAPTQLENAFLDRYARNFTTAHDNTTISLDGGYLIGLFCSAGWCGDMVPFPANPAFAGNLATRSWPAVRVDWGESGFNMANCDGAKGLMGLSLLQEGDRRANRALCMGDMRGPTRGTSSQFTASFAATVAIDYANPSDQRRALRSVPTVGGLTQEWDVGAFKLECGANEYVSAVSQSPDGKLHALRCSSLARLEGSCETVTFADGDARPSPSIPSDWDSGHFKGECPRLKAVFSATFDYPAGYMAGVSMDSSFRPRSLLCCH